MSLPTDDMEEREFYPYYMLFGHQNMPFKNAEERIKANKAIDEFIEIIGIEKTKNEQFAKKVEDIDFEVLFARPPPGKYSQYVNHDNFESVE